MRIDETIIAQAILTAPGWARIGISAPVERLRKDAAVELARVIIGQNPGPETDPNQLKLSL